MTTTQHARIDLPGRVALEAVLQGSPAGYPVVFLHGATDSWRSFEPVLPQLPASIRAIALSQRGHGDSGRPDGDYDPSDFAADVAAVLDRLGIERAVIAGHSMGSHVAQRFAIDHPDRTAGLVLAGAFYRFATNAVVTEYWDTVVSTLADPIGRSVAVEFQASTLARPVPPAFFDMVLRESLKVPARVWRDAFEGLLKVDHADRLGSIDVPTLIIWGDQDAFCPRADQDALLAAIADSRLVVYAGAGHALHWEEPVRYAADVAAFVMSL